MHKDRISPERDLRSLLFDVQMPGRYVGGEYGTIIKEGPAELTMALCFPDLYEIGMSNLAIRLLYRRINGLAGVKCERVFAPAPDFEAVLKEKDIPLYTLESGMPLHGVDLLGFSVGYELTATNMLTVLERGGIPLRRMERGEGTPLVIAGGPAITNPAPFADFLDAVWIGEAEGGFIDLVDSLRERKRRGGTRQDMLDLLRENPSIWIPGEERRIVKAVWQEFAQETGSPLGFVVPNIKTVQDHGIIEIMRGCPTGCRFCHAGFFYRPFRQKSIEIIEEEVENLIRHCGYREITLASLSSGDYNGIENLMMRLNRRYSKENISFAFPSMRVDSFTLPLLNQLSDIRKSGLTFAVETPREEEQLGLNKTVPLERTIAILNEAKKMGWRVAKFYFMLGLPFSRENEGEEIAAFLNTVQDAVKIRLNVNVGTFIPKPHTPFQWGQQISEEESLRRIRVIKGSLNRGIKLGYHSPFSSYLEGIISRGDDRVGELITSAYRAGARLDAWDDHLQRDLWREQIGDLTGETWDPAEVLGGKELDKALPWDDISLGVSRRFLEKEWEKAQAGERTPLCSSPCDHNCGVCKGETRTVTANTDENASAAISLPTAAEKSSQGVQNSVHQGPPAEYPRILFSFSKQGKALFLSHINVMQIMERAFLRADIPIRYTEGFNPKPRLEFAHPLGLGVSSGSEIASVDLMIAMDGEDFADKMNRSLPDGLRIERAAAMKALEPGKKRPSLMALYAGGLYTLRSLEEGKEPDFSEELLADWSHIGIEKKEDCWLLSDELYRKTGKNSNIRKFLEAAAGEGFLRSYSLHRESVLAKEKSGKDGRDYFELLTE